MNPWGYITLALFLVSCDSGPSSVEKECSNGTGEACNKAGKELEGRNEKGAREFFQKACDLGNTNGCVNLAEKLSKDNPEAAMVALSKACDKGNTHACAKLAEKIIRR